MADHSNLGTRMKTYYEQIPQTRLMRRCPVTIRLDGKAFHTFTKGFDKPFDMGLATAMRNTMKYLCENIQGCILGYTQSNEITLILVDYQNLETEAWFNYEVQKICSVSASMATLAFNKALQQVVILNSSQEKALVKGALFDSRAFNIPKEEVTNLVYWRQQDAIRNSIQVVGQANFSHKELQGKSCTDIKKMLLMQKNIDFDLDMPLWFIRGSCCIKTQESWIIDNEIPLFVEDGRNYIEQLI